MIFVGGAVSIIVGRRLLLGTIVFGNGAKLELAIIVDLMYLYLYEMALHNNLMHECRIASEAIVNWRKYVRHIYAEHFVAHSLTLELPCGQK